MKKIYLFFFLFFSISLFGQNWSPINFGDKYIFKSYENDYLASPYVANSYQNKYVQLSLGSVYLGFGNDTSPTTG